MRHSCSFTLIALTFLVNVALNSQDASSYSLERLLSRRQSGEGEQESTTTPKSQDGAQAQAPTSSQTTGYQGSGNGASSQSPRLYPDLLAQPPNFLPPFSTSPVNGFRPAAFVPFGTQVPPTNLLNPTPQQPAPFGRMPMQPRHMTAAERLQSQSFADGLGRRLLSMVGINMGDKSQPSADTGATSDTTESRQQGTQGQQPSGVNLIDNTMKALQNSTILQQLNRGVHSMYGGLSKMYNSTVQEQLNLLQERFKAETENSTNPWQQRMAQQVPVFFKQMASKVAEAQNRLNGVWQNIAQAGNNTSNLLDSTNRSAGSGQSRSFFAPIDQFMNGNDGSVGGGPSFFGPGQNDFFTQFGRSLGFNGNMSPGQQSSSSSPAPGATMSPNQNDLGVRLRDMWHNQIQPQIAMVRSQMARAWRDLTSSGALGPEVVNRSRMANNNLGSSSNSSSDLVDSILKEVDINNSDYSLVEPKSDGSQGNSAAPASTGVKLSPQMHNRLVEMQRELNQLWMGLTNSLQGAIVNVRRSLNPRPQFGPMSSMAPSGSANNQPQEVDQAQNEIDDKIRGLTKLQKDVDMVHEAVQQQQQETQQRQTFGDRFRGLFNNIDMNGVNQWSDRVGDRLNQFGNAVGNIWNQIPNRWDDFMTNARTQQQDTQAKLKTSTSTTTTNPVST